MAKNNMLEIIKTALNEGQASDLVALSARQQSSGLFSWMVIVTAGSSRHAAALTTRTLKALKNAGQKKAAVEASESGEWTLIDCGDVIVQIMQEKAREHYRLEELWGFESGAKTIEAG